MRPANWKLVADVGGTSTRVALFEGLSCIYKKIYASQQYEDIAPILRDFWDHLPQKAEPQELKICLALPGPVRQGRCKTTNLPWTVESDRLSELLGFPSIILMNDLEAHAYALELLEDQDLTVIQRGLQETSGSRSLLIAGTGLGEAGLFWDGKRHLPFATEGGHSDFAPNDEIDVALWRTLKERYGHVSHERLISGPGLSFLYAFLMEDKENKQQLSSYEIVDRALHKGCPVARRALEKFASLYGSEAGNLALKQMSLDGVYVGGSLANAILPSFQEAFLSAFLNKGRFRSWLEGIPLLLILNQESGLLGAASYSDLKSH